MDDVSFDPVVFDHLVKTIVSEFGISPDRIRPQTAIIDLDLDQQEYDRLYSALSEKTQVPLGDVFASMPMQTYGDSEGVMNSLRYLAGFSQFC